MSLCKRRGGEDGREKEKVCSLWIAQAIPVAQHLSLWPKPHLGWNNKEDNCSSVSALDMSYNFNCQTKCVHCTRCTEKLKAASNTILASCSQVCSRVFGGRGMNLIARKVINHCK